LVKSFLELPRMTIEAEEHMIGLFKILVDYAVQTGLVSMERNLVVDRVITWVDERVSRSRLPIAEIATQVHKSPSTLSRIVKRETGMSFRRLVVEKKLAAAEALFIASPESSVGEIAEAVGFRDQFFFSKLFKKYRGISPSQFVRRYRY
jgi:AraC-like DNA-binding protein